MTDEETENFEKKFDDKNILVRDHCHVTGKYKGSAHQDCNLNFQLTDMRVT